LLDGPRSRSWQSGHAERRRLSLTH
jgi:hypothetical protein